VRSRSANVVVALRGTLAFLVDLNAAPPSRCLNESSEGTTIELKRFLPRKLSTQTISTDVDADVLHKSDEG
jgi:hypothetical protein